MDEQTTLTPTTTSEATAESPAPPPEFTIFPAPAYADEEAGTESAETKGKEEAVNEIALNDDGEVEFSDGFFGDVEPPLSPPGPLSPPQGGKEGEELKGTGAAVSPAGYTDDELRDTPWEQWDAEKITGDVKRYIPILQEQMRRRQAVMAQMAAMPRASVPATQPQPAPMSNKEVTAAAAKLAKERLGLGEDDDLDFYEPEHVAALSIAAQEVKAQEGAQIERAAQIRQQQQQFGAFAADLASRHDFAQFDQWVTQKLAAAGMHPAQLQDYALRTGDIAGVQRTIQGWYQAWRQQVKPQPAPRQAPKVPAVETAGGAVAGKKVIDLRTFGDLDEDGQAQALMAAGIV